MERQTNTHTKKEKEHRAKKTKTRFEQRRKLLKADIK
jgi:hypothetical protein